MDSKTKRVRAAVSPWFFTHYGTGSFNKNWLFVSDFLWAQRWEQILQLKPQFLEIITWNGAPSFPCPSLHLLNRVIDFGESHYIGPLHPDKTSVYAGGDTGAIEWVTE